MKESKENLIRKVEYVEHILHKLKNEDHVNQGDIDYAHEMSQKILREISK